jgi:hypothetical protein
MRIIITGTRKPYLGPLDGAEIWTCNFAYKTQPNASRLYMMDPIGPMVEYARRHDDDLVGGLNRYGVPVYTQERYEDLKNNVVYPLEWVREQTTEGYFTSTIAYMIAHAIAEGATEIVLYEILVNSKSDDYMQQKSCFDFWVGFAMGRGIEVFTTENSLIAKPFPWQSGLYGYKWDVDNSVLNQAAHQLVNNAIIQASGIVKDAA